MFNSARIKLTAWYLLILFLISFSFSLSIYRFLSHEIDRFASIQRARMDKRIQIRFPDEVINKFPAPPEVSDPDIVTETKQRILITLSGINLIILVSSGFLSYFLSGKTLEPIKKMIDDQDRFISDASHELRTPLTSLKTNLEVSLRNKSLTAKSAKVTLQESLDDVNNLTKLATSLLDLSRSVSKKTTLNIQVNSLKTLVNKSVHQVLPQAKQKKIKIIQKIGNSKLLADAEKITQLISIILDNAIKYSPNSSQIRVWSGRNKKYLYLHISDEGPGISLSDQNKIFDRFYRVDQSRGRGASGGFGLGLSIAQSIINEHKGKIWLDSTIGKGTTFHLRLNIQKFS